MDGNSFSFLQDVIITLHGNIRELKERKNFADPEELSYIEGKLQGYMEMLGILRASAEEFDIPNQDFGL